MLTSIIIELLGTKMGKFNEIHNNVKQMNMKVANNAAF